MKITKFLVIATAVAVAVPSAASAERWQTINQRQAALQHRITMGVRDGSLNRREASRIRTKFANLKQLEHQYRRNGLSYRERTDLDRRFNALSQSIYAQKHDRQTRRHPVYHRGHR